MFNIDVQNSFEDYFYPVPGKERELCDLEEKEIEISEEQVKAMGASSNKIKALMQKDAVIHVRPNSKVALSYKELAANLLGKKYIKPSLFSRIFDFFN